jgi:hypothetical protein
MQEPIADKVEQFLDQNNIYSFEGGSGVRNLTKLVEALGYGGNFQDGLHEFLSDNSGAIQAVVEWISSQRSVEWENELDNHIEQEMDPDDVRGLSDDSDWFFDDCDEDQ